MLILMLFISGCGEKIDTKILLTDDFESGYLSEFWRSGNIGNGRYEQEAVSFTDQYYRSGNHCVKLVLKEGYIRQDGGDGNFTERTELDSGKYPFLNQEVWYRFSILVPKDFPIVDNRLVISQVKQTALLRNPFQIYAQRFKNGKHYITIYDMMKKDKEERTELNLPELTKEEWHDFVFQIRYSHTQNGFINMWMDGEKVISFTGPTASKKGRNQFYHKMGMYRDQWPDPMIIYFDNYIITNDTSKIDKTSVSVN